MIKNSRTRQTRDELPAADIFFERCGSHPPASLAFAIFEAASVSDMKKSPLSQPKPWTNSGRESCKGVSDEGQTKTAVGS